MSFKLKELLDEKGYIRGPFGSALRRNELLDEGIPVYEQQNAIYNNREFRYFINNEKYEEMKRFTVRENDLIISCSGTVGRVSVIRKDDPIGIISQALLILRPNTEKVLTDFLFYFFTSRIGYNSIISRSGGSVQANISKRAVIENIDIDVPPLPEQKSIVNILSALDKKIEVNNQINKTLENLAQEIFKQWFVEFDFPNEDGEPYKSSGGEMVESELGLIPKGWEVGKLEDIATIVMGQSPKGTSYNEEGEGEVFYQGRTDFSSRFPVRRLFTTEPKRMANEGDVLMSVRAPVGDLNVANERCCIGRGLSAISSSTDLSSYILYVIHKLRERLNVYNGEGTVFGSINQRDLKSLKVISSNDNRAEMAFDELIQPIDRMIRNNEDEIRRLINLRDRLLPKLMSGEIRVHLDEEGDVS